MAEGEYPLLDLSMCPPFPWDPGESMNGTKGVEKRGLRQANATHFTLRQYFQVHRRYWVKTIVGRFSVGKKQKDFLNPQL